MEAVEPKVVVAGHQHGRARAAERVRGRLGQRVERLLAGDRLAEHGGDPVEAALDPGLARALGEALGVAKGERGQVGERLEQPGVALGEAPLRVARADAEDAHHLARPAHRRHDRAAEALVARVRDRFRQVLVVVGEHGPAAGDRATREAAVGGELEADDALERAVDGGTAQHPAVLVEQEAIHRLGSEQRCHLVDEPLQDRVQLQLARDRLRGLQERGLLAETALVLVQEPARVQREADLARDRLGERDVAGRPDGRLGPVHPEHADHPVEDDHRRGERRAAAEPRQALDTAQRRIGELGCRQHVGDGDRPPLACRQVRDGQAGHLVADRLEALGPPLGPGRHRLRRSRRAG